MIIQFTECSKKVTQRCDYSVSKNTLSLTDETGNTNLYVREGTSIVTPACRGQGAMKRFYQAIIDSNPGKNVATRTWSGNDAHLHVLEKHGFELFARLPDDRGPGIDTVYFIRKP